MIGDKKPKLFYGYIVVAAATSIMTLVWGANRSFGVFLEPMLSEFGWTRAGISGAYTLCMVITGILTIPAGRLSDRFGPRVVLIGSGLLLGLGYILTSQVGGIWQLYLFYGGIVGVGMSGCFAPVMSLVARWFVKRRALMAGVLVAGAALGIAVMPLITSVLISAYGWRISYITLGIAVLIIVVASAQFLKRDPGKIGLLPYGADEAKAAGLDLQARGLSLGEALRTRQFWLINSLSLLDLFLINIVVVHIVIYAIGLGISATASASILAIGAAVSIPARIMMGGIADRIGNRPALMIVLIMSVVAFLVLLVAGELWMLYLFAVLYGFGLWAIGAILPPLSAELFGLKSHGTIFACTLSAAAIGGAIGPVLVGHIFDVTGSYQLGFLICVVVSVIAIILTIFLRPITDKGIEYSKST